MCVFVCVCVHVGHATATPQASDGHAVWIIDGLAVCIIDGLAVWLIDGLADGVQAVNQSVGQRVSQAVKEGQSVVIQTSYTWWTSNLAILDTNTGY